VAEVGGTEARPAPRPTLPRAAQRCPRRVGSLPHLPQSRPRDGTFHLPYQLRYSHQQLHEAYADVDAFFAQKRRYDPTGASATTCTSATARQRVLQPPEAVQPELLLLSQAEGAAPALRSARPAGWQEPDEPRLTFGSVKTSRGETPPPPTAMWPRPTARTDRPQSGLGLALPEHARRCAGAGCTRTLPARQGATTCPQRRRQIVPRRR